MGSTGVFIGLWFVASIAGVGGWNAVKFLATRVPDRPHVDRSVRAVPPAASTQTKTADLV